MAKPPVIVLGETTAHTWCATCQAPTRLRIPLHSGSASGPLLAVVEACLGCGASHAEPMVSVEPAPKRRLPSLPRLPQRDETSVCAYQQCRMPARDKHSAAVDGDDGRWLFRFCTARHRAAWAQENWIVLA